MKITHPALDRLCLHDTVREILAALEPVEIVIVWLRLAGHSYQDIAGRFGLTEAMVSTIMNAAVARISRQVDGAGSLLQGRSQVYQGRRNRPHQPGAETTPSQLARQLGVRPHTVTRWCRQGRFPHAYQTERGHWRIPAVDLDRFRRPAPGGDHRSEAYRRDKARRRPRR
jgi:excisionase family DNA binding protein